MTPILHAFLDGGITVAALANAYFFYRFKQNTGDRLFGFFAIAFLIFALERVLIVFFAGEYRFPIYLLRCIAFAVIACGILDKNRSAPKS